MTDPAEPVYDLARSLPAAALPAYVYDLGALRAHAASIREALPERVELYYAVKANPEPRILTALAPYLDGYEVSSGGELAHVTAALPGAALAFGGPGKTPDEVEDKLMRIIPDEYLYHAHHWLILHGRYCCKARRPECEHCIIADLCRSPEKTCDIPAPLVELPPQMIGTAVE